MPDDFSDILMNDWGIYVQPINYPTVPKGTERLQDHTRPLAFSDADIDHLVTALASLWQRCAICPCGCLTGHHKSLRNRDHEDLSSQ